MENKEVVLTFTVAECSEYHSLGEYHEGIKTLEDAVTIYDQIPPDRMNGVRAIGINLHVKGTNKREDSQVDILTGNEIDIGIISLMPEFCEDPLVQKAVKELIRMFPDKEVIDY